MIGAGDFGHAGRRLVRDWRFSVVAVLLLGVGIGANTAAFSVVNAALLRPQPLPRPDRLVHIHQIGVNPGALDACSYPAYLDIAEHDSLFAGTAATFVPRGGSYRDGGSVRSAVIEHATASYLSVLGLRPSLGRWFVASEDREGAPVVAVVSHLAWIRKFQGDPSVVGRAIQIDGVPVTIVGVGPAGHNGALNVGLVTDFWLPMLALRALGAPPRVLARRPDEAAVLVKARLRDDVTVPQVQAAMRVLGARLASLYPGEDPGNGIAVYPASEVRVHPQIDAVLRWFAAVLVAVMGLVLAIACSNLATLLLVRGAARAREFAIRLALGASRRQLVRSLLAESVLLAAAGGVAGCLLAWWALRGLTTIDWPVVVDVRFDLRVFAFALALSLATGVSFGLAPALVSARADIVPALAAGGWATVGRRGITVQRTLAVLQVGITVALLGLTALGLQLVSASRSLEAGFAVGGVAMIETDTRYGGYDAGAAARLFNELQRGIEAIPGVEAMTRIAGLPMQATSVPVVADAGAKPVVAGSLWAAPGFFDTLQIPIVYGRDIDERDRPDTPRVAVVSQTMARTLFGSDDAVGRRFRLEGEATTWFEVVGVARDTGTADRAGDLVDPQPRLFYQAVAQSDRPASTLVARTALGAPALLNDLQRKARAVDAALPVIEARTMSGHLETSLRAPLMASTFLGALAIVGACLAGFGLHAMVAFAVTRRSREIGIRMALGARGSQVVWAISREMVTLVGVGTVAGLLVPMLATLAPGAVSEPAPGIAIYRPTTGLLAPLVIAASMALVAMVAAAAPAWRASRLDPLVTLRED